MVESTQSGKELITKLIGTIVLCVVLGFIFPLHILVPVTLVVGLIAIDSLIRHLGRQLPFVSVLAVVVAGLGLMAIIWHLPIN